MMAIRKAVPAYAFGGLPRVNLMPRAAIERRARSTLLARWLWGLVTTILVVALIAGGAYAIQAAAQSRLAQEQSRTTELVSQMAALQPVRQKLTLQAELGAFRATAMGIDLAWRDVFTMIDSVLSKEVVVTGFTLSPGALPIGEDPTAEVGAQGDLVLSSAEPADIVSIVRSLRAVPQVLSADVWGQVYEDSHYAYTLRIQVDQTIYSGAFAKEVEQ